MIVGVGFLVVFFGWGVVFHEAVIFSHQLEALKAIAGVPVAVVLLLACLSLVF